jgi:single-strand DNA-binding protein
VQEPFITVTGHVGAPPRMRVLASGAVVTDFRVASTPRNKDKDTGVWTDGETMWFGVSCWRALAENVAASVHKGDKVVVSGRLTVSTWTTEKGEQRSGLEIVNPTVGFDLSRGTAVLHKNPPLTITTDPGYPVDIVTGEVLEDRDRVDDDDLLDDDEVSLGERVGALA